MTQPDHEFRVVLRGYEPAEVDRVVAGLQARAAEAEAAAVALERRVAEAASSSATPAEPPSYEHLGERVGQILALAEQEALEMRDRAGAETEGIRKLAEQAAIEIRDAADHYADQRRRDAETEATRLLADAKRAADEERDAADRDAAARAPGGRGHLRAAARRRRPVRSRLRDHPRRATGAVPPPSSDTSRRPPRPSSTTWPSSSSRPVPRPRRSRSPRRSQARRTLVDAEERAESIIREARAAADRVRSDSDRELAAATQRRDSINSQLTNVRQMLATLSGSATGFIVDPIAEDPAEAVDVSEEAEESPEETGEDTGREPTE